MNQKNKWKTTAIISFIFTALWGGTAWLSLHRRKTAIDFSLTTWILFTVLGGLVFLTSLGYYIKNNCYINKSQANLTTTETQNQGTEANSTNNIETTSDKEIEVPEVIDENQKALEDLEKEIAVLKKQKEVAGLKKEIRELEGVQVVASTSM